MTAFEIILGPGNYRRIVICSHIDEAISMAKKYKEWLEENGEDPNDIFEVKKVGDVLERNT